MSNFVPKPGTPFQWSSIPTREEWRRRQQVVRDECTARTVKVKFHDVEVSHLEALFARGDRRLAPVLKSAWRRGARFDSWDDQLKLDAWQAAFEEHQFDADTCALRARDLDEVLPWAVVANTVSTAFLKREVDKSNAQQTTSTCADPEKDPCHGCAACARSPLFEVGSGQG